MPTMPSSDAAWVIDYTVTTDVLGNVPELETVDGKGGGQRGQLRSRW